METVILVIHLMLVLALIVAVLLQRSEGGGLGMGGGGTMSSRGTANALTRGTAILATGFFITSLVLTYMATIQRKPASIVQPSQPSQSAPAQPGSPAPPMSGGNLLDQLKGPSPSAPPPAPQQ